MTSRRLWAYVEYGLCTTALWVVVTAFKLLQTFGPLPCLPTTIKGLAIVNVYYLLHAGITSYAVAKHINISAAMQAHGFQEDQHAQVPGRRTFRHPADPETTLIVSNL